VRKLFVILLVSSAFAASPAPAVIVFGNLGSDGSGGLNTFNDDIRATNLIVQGFSTGSSSLLVLQSITFGLFGTSIGTISGSVGLYDDLGGVPGTLLYTSTNSAIGDIGKYTFNFAGLVLAPSQTYWVMPNPDLSWYLNAPLTAPGEQNASGYSYAGTLRSTNGAVSWGPAAVPHYSISVNADVIPEPGTWLAGALLCGTAAWVGWRRRRGS
jgi:hypothetical protein